MTSRKSTDTTHELKDQSGRPLLGSDGLPVTVTVLGLGSPEFARKKAWLTAKPGKQPQ